ncbi:MAG TPA: hypothetical protein VGG89_11400 [Candidatus Baltobacteraceae bacterium]|jgi:streptogramin lyase
MKRTLVFSALALAALSACSGGNGVLPSSFVGGAAGRHRTTTKSHATIVISIPTIGAAARRQRQKLHRHYVSPATQSVAIAVTFADATVKSFNADLTPASNSHCVADSTGTTCTITADLPVGNYTAAFTTYDGLLSGKTPTGHVLSANQSIPFSIKKNNPNDVKVVLDGIPTAVAFIPSASSTIYGNQTLGYVMPRCSPTPQSVSVVGIDADGNFIVGHGAPAVTLRSGSSMLAVSTPKPSSPNTFVLMPPKPPTYPPGGSAVFLEALATPRSGSGGIPVALVLKITFSSDICGVVTEFPLPSASSQPFGITVGSDNAIWFTEKNTNKIGRIPTTATLSNSQITEYTLPTANAGPISIAAGSDGALWFAEYNVGQIGRIPMNGSPIFEFVVPTAHSFPRAIAAGPDGAMWFTELLGNKIGRIPTSGPIVVMEFSVPTASSQPAGIAPGPDGAMWFTESSGNKVGRITTDGTSVADYSVGASVKPFDLAAGPDGNLWFTQCGAHSVGTVATAGSPVTEYLVPAFLGFPATTYGITAGPDSAMWFTNEASQSIGRVATDGSFSQFPLATAAAHPVNIIKGPDGNLWFTEFLGNKVGRIQ